MTSASPEKVDVKGDVRSQLPGMSSKLSRVNQELIYRDLCNTESKYFESRKAMPPQPKQSYGEVRGFDVERNTSYINVRPSAPPPASMANFSVYSAQTAHSKRSVRSVRSIREQEESYAEGVGAAARSSQASRPGSSGSIAAAGAGIVSGDPFGRSRWDERKFAQQSLISEKARILAEMGAQSLYVLPKYGLTQYSMSHMKHLETAPSATGENLRRAMTQATPPSFSFQKSRGDFPPG